MSKNNQLAANDIVTLTPANSEVGALGLITLDPVKYVAEIFKPFHAKLDELIEKDPGLCDIGTTAGMALAIERRAGFRDDVRIASEKARVDRKAPLLQIGKLIDSEHKALVALCAPHEKFWDDLIQAENRRKEEIKAEKERIEAARIHTIRAKIADIVGIPAKHAASTSNDINAALHELALREVEPEEYAELTHEARAAVETAATKLLSMRDSAKTLELLEEQRLAAVAEEKRKLEAQAEANRIESERLDKLAEEARLAQAERDRQASIARAEETARIAAIKLKEQEAEAAARAESNRLDKEREAFEAEKAAFMRKKEMDAAPAPEVSEAEVVAPAIEAAPVAVVDPDPAHELKALIDAVPRFRLWKASTRSISLKTWLKGRK